MTQKKINSLSYSLTIACLAADLHYKLSEEADETGDEAQSDIYYSDYHKSCDNIAEILVELTGGEIDNKTAKRMAHFKREEILALYDKHTTEE